MSYYIIKDAITADIAVSAYLQDDRRIHIAVLSPSNKYNSISIRWQYRYITNDAYSLSDGCLRTSTDTYDFWDAIIEVYKVDVNFVVRGIVGDKAEWFSEVGMHDTVTDALPFSFIIPMISDGALHRFIPVMPQWLLGGTIYEIFVDRFRKHKETEGCLSWNMRPPQNDFFHLLKFGGTLQGIIHSIIFDGCYLKELGIGCIYLTPIFQSPSNHKYNATDYYAIDKAFGDEEDLKNLTEEAHKNGISLILDGVFNHCSDTLKVKGENSTAIEVFADLRKNGRCSKYHSWVQWSDESHWRGFANLSHMPILNTEDEDCANYFVDVADYWTSKFKIDGWRLDVANEIGTEFIKKLKKKICANSPDIWLLGEILHDGRSWIGHDKLSGITNHQWRECVIKFVLGEWTSGQFDEHLQMLWHRYPSTFYPGIINYLNNHDTPRILTCLNKRYDYYTSIEYNYIAAILLFTSIGSPMMLYGEEIGMEGEGDPDCRKCMEWDVSLWEPYKVEKKLDLKKVYSKLISLRKNNPWLSSGAWETIISGTNSLYVYKRSDCEFPFHSGQKKKELIVLINACNEECVIDIFNNLDYDIYQEVMSGLEVSKNDFSCIKITAHTGMVFISCQ